MMSHIDKECAKTLKQVSQLERELAEARKDAERYRWLRENNFQEPTPKGFRTTLEEIDAAIDEAMKEMK